MTTIFCEVDIQNDFVNGSLATNPDKDTLYNMARLTKSASFLLGSIDSHEYDAWEFNTNENKGPNGEDPQFPPHCIVGTYGWIRYFSSLERKIQFINSNQASIKIKKDTDSIFLMKEVYSIFSNSWINYVETWLKDRFGKFNVVVYGIATDYCVKEAALGFRGKGYETFLVQDAIASVTKDGEKKAFEEMKHSGIKMISTEEALQML